MLVVQWLSSYKMGSANQVYFLGEAVCIFHCTYVPEKDINQTILPSAMGKS